MFTFLNCSYDRSYKGEISFTKAIWIRPNDQTLAAIEGYLLEYTGFKKLFEEDKKAIALPQHQP
jgi:hypothetical protein